MLNYDIICPVLPVQLPLQATVLQLPVQLPLQATVLQLPSQPLLQAT